MKHDLILFLFFLLIPLRAQLPPLIELLASLIIAGDLVGVMDGRHH